MTIDDLLKMWVNWLRLPCLEGVRVTAKHPLARLMDGSVGGRPIYCSMLPYDVAVDNSVACQVEKAIAKLNKGYCEVIKAEYLTVGEQEYKAESFGLSVNAYRIRLCRAKRILSLMLKDLLNPC